MKKIYEIDGNNFSTLEEFYEQISSILIPCAKWGKNLDAFDDILSGGFGTPPEGFILIWNNSNISREKLGNAETGRQYEMRLRAYDTVINPNKTNMEFVSMKLEKARNNIGPTIYDVLIHIIKEHCDSKDGIELILK